MTPRKGHYLIGVGIIVAALIISYLTRLDSHLGPPPQAPALISGQTSQMLHTSPRIDPLGPPAPHAICQSPHVVSVGTVDPQFETNETEVTALLNEAIQEWNTATGRIWFSTTGRASLTVNVLYDGRQEDTINAKREREELDQASETLKAWKDHEAASASELTEQRQLIEEDSKVYNERLLRFEQAREYLMYRDQNNHRGFQMLEIEKDALDQIYLDLIERRSRFNATNRELSERSKESSKEVGRLIERIETFNDRFVRAGEPFACAQHRRGAEGESVDIFAFADFDELYMTILHELGHSIGLSHSPEPTSIMYPIRNFEAQGRHLSALDIESARARCSR